MTDKERHVLVVESPRTVLLQKACVHQLLIARRVKKMAYLGCHCPIFWAASIQMAKVEIRLPPTEVSARLDEMRRWLSARGIRPVRFTSTGSAFETVVIVEFGSSDDAEAFAKGFAGTLIAS